VTTRCSEQRTCLLLHRVCFLLVVNRSSRADDPEGLGVSGRIWSVWVCVERMEAENQGATQVTWKNCHKTLCLCGYRF